MPGKTTGCVVSNDINVGDAKGVASLLPAISLQPSPTPALRFCRHGRTRRRVHTGVATCYSPWRARPNHSSADCTSSLGAIASSPGPGHSGRVATSTWDVVTCTATWQCDVRRMPVEAAQESPLSSDAGADQWFPWHTTIRTGLWCLETHRQDGQPAASPASPMLDEPQFLSVMLCSSSSMSRHGYLRLPLPAGRRSIFASESGQAARSAPSGVPAIAASSVACEDSCSRLTAARIATMHRQSARSAAIWRSVSTMRPHSKECARGRKARSP